MILRREFCRYGTHALGALMGLALGVPGVAYLLDPLTKKTKDGESRRLARLSELTPGAPKSFPVVEERQDAWVNYPREPVGSVWLVRQPEGAEPPVIAFTAECPHLGCAINLNADGKSFLCPCHTSAFTLDGKPSNKVPPRGMDRLEVELSDDGDPEILVRFQRFQTQIEEQKPLV